MKIAISIGDPNGIGLEIALKAHEKISKFCNPIYFAGMDMLEQVAKKLDIKLPKDLTFISPTPACMIEPSVATAKAGAYSFASFKKAVDAVKNRECEAVVTLPINKESWKKAGIEYKGHTDALRDFFKKEAIMMLGCKKMYVALFTEHIPLKDVPKKIKKKPLVQFLIDFQKETNAKKIGVLGLNPHAGENGVLGDEEKIITEAIREANQKNLTFIGPLVPDIAFSPKMRKSLRYYVAMYHDQGLAPLKALYFDESINVSLNLPIVRTSVDHGTAFDIAYQKNRPINLRSYIEAVKAAIEIKKKRDNYQITY